MAEAPRYIGFSDVVWHLANEVLYVYEVFTVLRREKGGYVVYKHLHVSQPIFKKRRKKSLTWEISIVKNNLLCYERRYFQLWMKL